MAPDYGVVTGNFLTPGQSAGAPVPLSGTIVFTPTSKTQVDGILYVSQSTGYVVAGKLCDDPAGADVLLSKLPRRHLSCAVCLDSKRRRRAHSVASARDYARWWRGLTDRFPPHQL